MVTIAAALLSWFLAGAVHAAAPVVIDNTSAQFSTVGTWDPSSGVPGFEGTNYLWHYAQAFVVDNADAGFSVTGSWSGSSGVSGYWGDNYLWRYRGPTAPAESATWTPTIPSSTSYRVYARWTAHANRATNAVYTITHAAGSTAVSVNQQVGGGQWNLLGTFTLNPGQGHKVTLGDDANAVVVADAIRVVPSAEPVSNTATWTPGLAGTYEVYAKWTAYPNRATNAPYAINHAGGTRWVMVNQQVAGGQWNLLGTFTLTAQSTITLSDDVTNVIVADAIQLIATTPPQAYYIHTDQLDTPRVITNNVGAAVWQWDNLDPFGANVPLGNFTCNLRLPGQGNVPESVERLV